MAEREQSIGERRVRIGFNPSKDSLVDKIKAQSAALIDVCEELKTNQKNPEMGRCAALAQKAYEEAAMWAVKSATA